MCAGQEASDRSFSPEEDRPHQQGVPSLLTPLRPQDAADMAAALGGSRGAVASAAEDNEEDAMQDNLASGRRKKAVGTDDVRQCRPRRTGQ